MKVNKKGRIIHLLKLLEKQTDQNHPMSTADIINYFKEKGIDVDRHTLKNDIAILEDENYDIIAVKKKSNWYYMGERNFELPEIKLLIDAVSSSHFATKKKTEKLIEKLRNQVSVYQADKLERHLFFAKSTKPDNEYIYYVMDTVDSAIDEEKKITFQYTEYDVEKNKILRNDGEVYTVSPYMLLWKDDYYYMICYSEKREKVIPFRVDRMVDVKIMEDNIVPKPDDFNPEEFENQIFYMYGGESQEVILECENNLMKVMIDKFGENVVTQIISPERFQVITKVDVSKTFFGWIFQFAGDVRIIGPEATKKQYEDMLNDVMKIQDKKG